VARCLDKISRLLSETQRNLPPGTPPPIVSRAAYLAAVQTIEGNPMSLKAWIRSLGFSDVGLREPLQKLLDEGWVMIVRDSDDQRVRRVVATDRLLNALVQFADLIEDHERDSSQHQDDTIKLTYQCRPAASWEYRVT
jgi:hypothetical protein